MKEHSERRRFQRVLFNAETQASQANQSWSCQLVDISLKGVLLSVDDRESVQEQEPIQVAITLAEDAHINLTCKLARREGEYLGLTCTEIDLESLGHLRRLIELNLGDATASERELSELFLAHNDEH